MDKGCTWSGAEVSHAGSLDKGEGESKEAQEPETDGRGAERSVEPSSEGVGKVGSRGSGRLKLPRENVLMLC